jgi:hypothetical protein
LRRAAALAALLAACSTPPPPEAPSVLPPFPPRGEFIEFTVPGVSEFRFFIEAGTLSVGADEIVRYVLIARSAGGVVNVSYEGLRCDNGEVRLYATGGEAGWVGRPGEWRTVDARAAQRWHHTLWREYFCPQRQRIYSRSEGLDALRKGGNPASRGGIDDIPRGF